MTPPPAPVDAGHNDGEPISNGSHVSAILFLLRKAHAELVGIAAADQRLRSVHTRGDARRYANEILPLLRAERERRRYARRQR